MISIFFGSIFICPFVTVNGKFATGINFALILLTLTLPLIPLFERLRLKLKDPFKSLKHAKTSFPFGIIKFESRACFMLLTLKFLDVTSNVYLLFLSMYPSTATIDLSTINLKSSTTNFLSLI